jgi:hypothetical protein
MKLKVLIAAAVLALRRVRESRHGENEHGGRVVMAGAFHVELVAKDGTIEVHLIDHSDKPMTVSGYKGLAILAIDGKSQRIVLEPAGEAQLSGKAAGALPSRPKGVVQITPPDGKVVSARFD